MNERHLSYGSQTYRLWPKSVFFQKIQPTFRLLLRGIKPCRVKTLLLFILWLFISINPVLGQDLTTNDAIYQKIGVQGNLPVFYEKIKSRMVFPLSYGSGKYMDFSLWKRDARSEFYKLLGPEPPKAASNPIVIDEEDRGSYVAQKVVFNITADSRVLGYLLIPKGDGPFPSVYLLHDHSAKFDIGKEKMIKPFKVSDEIMSSANEFVKGAYEGRYVGDELAKRGYVCFSTDALNWGDRGGGGYAGQQALASNLMHMGSSFASLMAWEDLNGLEFLYTHQKVDKKRIAAMGLSMGSFRAWRLAAMSDKIAASVSICWMTTIKNLIEKDNNVLRGNSSYSMLHPGMFNLFDYPDVASIACPKPALFYNGLQDKLFSIKSVEEAYEKMHKVWKSQDAAERLETKLWDVPHVFNIEMQEESFQWLDKQLK